MTEQELVKWFTSNIITRMTQRFNEAETLEDLKDLRTEIRETAKQMKPAIKMMDNYLQVAESIKNDTDKE